MKYACLLAAGLVVVSCQQPKKETSEGVAAESNFDKSLLNKYTSVTLTADLSHLTDKEKQMIPLLIKVGQIIDGMYWYEAYGKKDSLLAAIQDADARKYVEINYGPWDKLNGDSAFLPGVGPKPAGQITILQI